MPRKKYGLTAPALVALGLAAVAPNAFPAAQAGYGSLQDFGIYAILPAAALLVGLFFLRRRRGDRRTADAILYGALAGIVATFALEAIRYPAFRLGFMPGNLPDLMGVLLLDRFAEGPSAGSTLAGYAYHFWNGACFGVIFTLIAGMRRALIWPVVYGLLIGAGFMVSPVVESLGIGWFGVDFGWSFAATVTVAHIAWGAAFGYTLRIFSACGVSVEAGGRRSSCSVVSSAT